MVYQSVVCGTFALELALFYQSNPSILPEQLTWKTGLCKQLAWPLKFSLTEIYCKTKLDTERANL